MIVHCTAVNNNGGKRKYSTVDRIYYGERFSCGRLNESNQTVSNPRSIISASSRKSGCGKWEIITSVKVYYSSKLAAILVFRGMILVQEWYVFSPSSSFTIQ